MISERRASAVRIANRSDSISTLRIPRNCWRRAKLTAVFAAPEELEEERRQAIAQHRSQIYSGKCRNLTKPEIKESLLRGKTYSVRLKIPDHPIRFHDIVRGDLEFAAETISDPILVRSAQGGTAGMNPGVPVYNYVVTVDDALMGITHVIRGDDHIANTPKQVAIYEAFGWKVPEFVHLSTILGQDRERLSKRHGATSMSGFREMGYLPEALVNYLALLGLGVEDGQDRNLYSRPACRGFFAGADYAWPRDLRL